MGVFSIVFRSFLLVYNTIYNTRKMDFKNIFSFNSQEQEEQSCFPNLSWNERLIGFAICCSLGILTI